MWSIVTARMSIEKEKLEKQPKNKACIAQSIDSGCKSDYNHLNNRQGKGEPHVQHSARFLLLL